MVTKMRTKASFANEPTPIPKPIASTTRTNKLFNIFISLNKTRNSLLHKRNKEFVRM